MIMEQKLVKVPFEVEMAKKITNGEVEGKIVTREGNSVRIVCWDKKDITYNIAALVDNGDEEDFKSYTNEGIWNTDKTCTLKRYDLMLEIPEYLTFKDGDIVACGWEEHNESSSWISIIKSVNTSAYGVRTSDYVILITKSNNNTDGVIKYDSYTTSGEWIRKATEEEKQKLIDALKENKEPKAKEYLKRFFPKYSNSLNIGKNYEFKPFDKVLARECETDKWRADLFSHMNEEGEFICIGYVWDECIPYNEKTAHLIGTTGGWEE